MQAAGVLGDDLEVDGGIGGIVSRLIGGGVEAFMERRFGRQLMLKRWSTPRVRFDIQDCLDVMNGVSKEEMKGLKMVKSIDLGPDGYAFEKLSGAKTMSNFLREASFKSPSDLLERADDWTFTLVLGNGVNADMHNLHHELWAHFGLPTGMNSYLTPPSAQGLSPHADPHDVFVMQQEGTKEWTIFEDDFCTKKYEITLTPGDVLYLPSGVPHCAKSSNVSSLHLSASVFRGDFTASGMLAACLGELGTRHIAPLSDAVMSNHSCLQRRLSSQSDPWDPTNQLLDTSLSIPLLRAFDESDLPVGAAAAAARELMQIAHDVAERLRRSGNDAGIELARRLHAQGDLAETDQVENLLKSIFATREYHWVNFYATHRPKIISTDPASTHTLASSTRVRRRGDANALLSPSGDLLINGYRVSDISEDSRQAIRFCMSLVSGTAGCDFSLGDIPGDVGMAIEVAKLLFSFDGLELAVAK